MRPRRARLLRRNRHRPVPGMHQSALTGIELANRTIRFAGQEAGKATAGLLETFEPTTGWRARIATGLAGVAPALPNAATAKKHRGILTRLADWLDRNDYGYPLGLLAYMLGAVALCLQAWWLAAPLIIIAFALCWWFG